MSLPYYLSDPCLVPLRPSPVFHSTPLLLTTNQPPLPFLGRSVLHQAYSSVFLCCLPLFCLLLFLLLSPSSQHRQPRLTACLVVAQLAADFKTLGLAVCIDGCVVWEGEKGWDEIPLLACFSGALTPDSIDVLSFRLSEVGEANAVCYSRQHLPIHRLDLFSLRVLARPRLLPTHIRLLPSPPFRFQPVV